MTFPPGFRFGVSTAAFQIEGAWDADGKWPSVWDTVLQAAGGDTGDVACDHYHRLDEDLDLIAGLGVDTYRFSVSWPRCLTPAGFDFYDRLVDGLLERGIEPMLTLYHWDHPQAIEDAGGWLNADNANRFADHVARLVDRLGHRVPFWITLNEPLSVLHQQIDGFGRPGGALGPRYRLTVRHHLLLAHRLALQALDGVPHKGIVLNLSGFEPATEQDAAAADEARKFENWLFLDPVLEHGGIDFLGVNWYAPARIEHGARVDPEPRSLLGWTIDPGGLRRLLRWLKDAYPDIPPILITENGLPLDEPDASGDDGPRIAYLDACLREVASATRDGMDIRGYFVWSLLDNLEWQHGYRPRFGLVHVDFDTLVRTPKASYRWYRDVIAAQKALV